MSLYVLDTMFACSYYPTIQPILGHLAGMAAAPLLVLGLWCFRKPVFERFLVLFSVALVLLCYGLCLAAYWFDDLQSISGPQSIRSIWEAERNVARSTGVLAFPAFLAALLFSTLLSGLVWWLIVKRARLPWDYEGCLGRPTAETHQSSQSGVPVIRRRR